MVVAREIVQGYPAPTLQEIMLALKESGLYCPTCFHHANRWVVDCEDNPIDEDVSMLPVLHEEEDLNNPAAAALKLWLELNSAEICPVEVVENTDTTEKSRDERCLKAAEDAMKEWTELLDKIRDTFQVGTIHKTTEFTGIVFYKSGFAFEIFKPKSMCGDFAVRITKEQDRNKHGSDYSIKYAQTQDEVIKFISEAFERIAKLTEK